jgi:hypothetical protein
MTEVVDIGSLDHWFKVVDFLQTNWALIDLSESGATAYFLGDTGGVFDEISFVSVDAASTALQRNGFRRFASDPKAASFLHPPVPPFIRRQHPNGPIYSSGRFWRL